jgi:hypothetical protein
VAEILSVYTEDPGVSDDALESAIGEVGSGPMNTFLKAIADGAKPAYPYENDDGRFGQKAARLSIVGAELTAGETNSVDEVM